MPVQWLSSNIDKIDFSIKDSWESISEPNYITMLKNEIDLITKNSEKFVMRAYAVNSINDDIPMIVCRFYKNGSLINPDRDEAFDLINKYGSFIPKEYDCLKVELIGEYDAESIYYTRSKEDDNFVHVIDTSEISKAYRHKFITSSEEFEYKIDIV